MNSSGDLFALVSGLVRDAGLYQPDSGAGGLVLSCAGQDVVISWARSAPLPAVRTAVAIRTALIELISGADLTATYQRAPGERSGTITVSRAADPRAGELCAVD